MFFGSFYTRVNIHVLIQPRYLPTILASKAIGQRAVTFFSTIKAPYHAIALQPEKIALFKVGQMLDILYEIR